MTERISTLFQPSVLNWNSIQFDSCISALQPFNSGNIMKVIKTWMNAWTTSSRMGGAHHIYPCLFGCSDVTDRLGHYIECPRGCLLCGNICIAIYQFMQPRGGASAHPAKVTLCTFAVFFLRTTPHPLMSSRTMNFMGLLTSLSNF